MQNKGFGANSGTKNVWVCLWSIFGDVSTQRFCSRACTWHVQLNSFLRLRHSVAQTVLPKLHKNLQRFDLGQVFTVCELTSGALTPADGYPSLHVFWFFLSSCLPRCAGLNFADDSLNALCFEHCWSPLEFPQNATARVVAKNVFFFAKTGGLCTWLTRTPRFFAEAPLASIF